MLRDVALELAVLHPAAVADDVEDLPFCMRDRFSDIRKFRC
jgi:hypothetical protein